MQDYMHLYQLVLGSSPIAIPDLRLTWFFNLWLERQFTAQTRQVSGLLWGRIMKPLVVVASGLLSRPERGMECEHWVHWTLPGMYLMSGNQQCDVLMGILHFRLTSTWRDFSLLLWSQSIWILYPHLLYHDSPIQSFLIPRCHQSYDPKLYNHLYRTITVLTLVTPFNPQAIALLSAVSLTNLTSLTTLANTTATTPRA